MGYFCFHAKQQRPTANSRESSSKEKRSQESFTMENALLHRSVPAPNTKEIPFFCATSYCLHMFTQQRRQLQPFLSSPFSKVREYKNIWLTGLPSNEENVRCRTKVGLLTHRNTTEDISKTQTSSSALLPLPLPLPSANTSFIPLPTQTLLPFSLKYITILSLKNISGTFKICSSKIHFYFFKHAETQFLDGSTCDQF